MRYDGSYHELGEISQITELSEFSKITSFYFKARQRIKPGKKWLFVIFEKSSDTVSKRS